MITMSREKTSLPAAPSSSLTMHSDQQNTDWFSMSTPAVAFPNSPVFTNVASPHPHLPWARWLLSSSRPLWAAQAAPGPPSSPDAWLQKGGTPGCGADSSTGWKQLNSLCDKVGTALEHFPCPLHAFHFGVPQQHPGACIVLILRSSLHSPKLFHHQLAGRLNWKSWDEIFGFAPTCRLSLNVCSCAGLGGRLCPAPSGMALGHRGLGLPPGWTELWHQTSWQISQFRQCEMSTAPLVSLNHSPFPLDSNKSSAFALDLI